VSATDIFDKILTSCKDIALLVVAGCFNQQLKVYDTQDYGQLPLLMLPCFNLSSSCRCAAAAYEDYVIFVAAACSFIHRVRNDIMLDVHYSGLTIYLKWKSVHATIASRLLFKHSWEDAVDTVVGSNSDLIRVRRDGIGQDVERGSIVVGDIILLDPPRLPPPAPAVRAGVQGNYFNNVQRQPRLVYIPADGILLSGQCVCDEGHWTWHRIWGPFWLPDWTAVPVVYGTQGSKLGQRATANNVLIRRHILEPIKFGSEIIFAEGEFLVTATKAKYLARDYGIIDEYLNAVTLAARNRFGDGSFRAALQSLARLPQNFVDTIAYAVYIVVGFTLFSVIASVFLGLALGKLVKV
jgi:hypothetical protein